MVIGREPRIHTNEHEFFRGPQNTLNKLNASQTSALLLMTLCEKCNVNKNDQNGLRLLGGVHVLRARIFREKMVTKKENSNGYSFYLR